MEDTTGGRWDPEVGDRRPVVLEIGSTGTLAVVEPDVSKSVEIASQFDHPSGTRIETDLEVIEQSGITSVVAEPRGEQQISKPIEEPTGGPDRQELLDSLRRLAAALGETPTTNDVSEHGEYDREAYTEEFDSFVTALEEANLEPSELQYRFSSKETPEELRGTQNVECLREHGPAPIDDLPGGVGRQDKRHGAANFAIHNNVGSITRVVYLMEDHDEAEVLETFFDANPHVLENNSQRTLVSQAGNHGPQFRDAARRIVPQRLDRIDD